MLLGIILFGIFAFARQVNSSKVDRIVANSETPEGFISSLSGIEFKEYGNPKLVVSYYSVVYGISYDSFYNTINCESGFQHDGLYGDSGRAYGISQFWESTFKAYCPDLQYKVMEDQLQCMGRMFAMHQQYQWTCFHNS